MAEIRPFRAIRPASGLTEQIAALPYDVFSRAEARAFVSAHPDAFLAIDRPETQFPENYDMYADEVYEKAYAMLEERVAKGDFLRDAKPCYYIYEQTFRGRTQTGIVACAAIEDYLQGIVRKHENTREEKERDRIRHVDTVNAQTGPIFLCYRKRDDLTALLQEIRNGTPYADFEKDDGVRTRLFRVEDDERIETIRRAFEDTPRVYIADGHHRCASAVRVGEMRRKTLTERLPDADRCPSEYFLCVLFADDELEILDYNRFVKDLNGMTPEAFLEEIGRKFSVEEIKDAGAGEAFDEQAVRPKEKGTFAMYLDGVWYRLKAHPDVQSEDAVLGLDVSVLQDALLSPVLGIGDPRTDERIDFVGGIRGLKELVRRCETDMRVAFALHPTSLAELIRVADEERLMPPKSTWFEPKLLSGLFLHTLEPDKE